jgi:uncharacterized protein (DUF1810 family)
MMRGAYLMFHSPVISVEFKEQPVNLAYDIQSIEVKKAFFARMIVMKSYLITSEAMDLVSSIPHVVYTFPEAYKLGLMDEEFDW